MVVVGREQLTLTTMVKAAESLAQLGISSVAVTLRGWSAATVGGNDDDSNKLPTPADAGCLRCEAQFEILEAEANND